MVEQGRHRYHRRLLACLSLVFSVGCNEHNPSAFITDRQTDRHAHTHTQWDMAHFRDKLFLAINCTGIDNLKHCIHPKHETLTETDGTWRAAVDGYASMCCDLDLWPFNPKIWSANLWAQIHLWLKLVKIPFTGFWDIVFTRFSIHSDSHTHGWTDLIIECLWHCLSTVAKKNCRN